ncbi:MAG: glycoside hydrolase family 127 protein, partial [Halanaerobiaceae bacterium]
MKNINKLNHISWDKVNFNQGFWGNMVNLANEKVIPYQWEALNDEIPEAEPSHAIENFRIAAGKSESDFQGMVFQDSDVAKWLEAVGYSLASNPNPDLEAKADEVIDLIAEAQQENGYLNTYFTVKEPDKKWTNLRDWHELYCAGHMIEAAVSYYKATGKDKLLKVMERFADLIDEKFGTDSDQMRGYPGHEEIELALVKLYDVTGKENYLKLSQFFIDERGKEPNYFRKEAKDRGDDPDYWELLGYKYNQAHLPVREQEEAVGHSVRAVYLYSGMADIARETGDKELFEACKKLWENTVEKRMYITGGIGSSGYAESFTFDYDLPNDTAYTETCAAIGLVFWAQRMLNLELDSEYADIMEKALYNGVLSGISQDGEKYFYVNPLEVWPEANEKRRDQKHVESTRQRWFGCACCPPNIARLLASLGNYVYSKDEAGIYTHLYTDNEMEVELKNNTVKLSQETDYPWKGNIKVKVSPDKEAEFVLGFRIPGWCKKQPEIKVNGEKIELNSIKENGYVKIKRKWKKGDNIKLNFPVEVKRMYSHPEVRENAGKVALQRGPVVYCLEEVDNGSNLSGIYLPEESKLTAIHKEDLLEGITVIKGKALRVEKKKKEGLYSDNPLKFKETEIRAIPYYAWDNRESGEMTVWLNEK